MIKCALQFEIFTILNSLQFSIKLNQIKCWFLRGENRSTRRKTSRSRVENQQTQPTYDAESGNRTRDTLVEGERSHHCANPAPRTGDDVEVCAKVSLDCRQMKYHRPNFIICQRGGRNNIKMKNQNLMDIVSSCSL